jgi:hypothetical protein
MVPFLKMSGELHAPFTLHPGEKPNIPPGYEIEWVEYLVWTLWRRKNSLALPGFKPQFLDMIFYLGLRHKIIYEVLYVS